MQETVGSIPAYCFDGFVLPVLHVFFAKLHAREHTGHVQLHGGHAGERANEPAVAVVQFLRGSGTVALQSVHHVAYAGQGVDGAFGTGRLAVLQ